MDESATIDQSMSVLTMITHSGPVVFAVLMLLIVLSLGSWTITIVKFLQFRRAQADSLEFDTLFWETKSLDRLEDSARRLEASPLAQLFRSGYRELLQLIRQPEIQARGANGEEALNIVQRALKKAQADQVSKLEQGLTFLATVASSAPFIGLFGTVWGIMNAFHGLGFQKTSTIQAVAPGISEALVATAVGLAAAIPAAIAYNYAVVAVRRFREVMERFGNDFMALARRDALRVP